MDPQKLLETSDPGAVWRVHQAELDAATRRVFASGRYILGPEVSAFEREWARYLGAGVSVGVASGTDALELALRAAGVARGDLVVTVANTASATATAIERAGARLACAEIDPATFVLDVPALAAWLARSDAPAVRAVVPVHLYGHPVDMPALGELSRRHDFAVVEDCAQAHGARVAGRRVGTFGVTAGFSFYPTKNLGAFGDGGAVVTSDMARAERVWRLRQYGWALRHVSTAPGMNSRLDELQAALLRVLLPGLDAANRRRAAIAAAYLDGLRDTTVRLPQVAAGVEPVWHQFVVRHPTREALRQHLERAGIAAAVLYPVPIHRQPAYQGRTSMPPGGLPEAERACDEVLSLPIHPHLSDADVARVIDAVRAFR